MKQIATTEYLVVFESPEFVIGGDYTMRRRLYVAFDPIEGAVVHTPMPLVTALVSAFPLTRGERPFFEWLETARPLCDKDDDLAQEVRDEFMHALRTYLPTMGDPDPETQEAEDGTVRYADTADVVHPCP